MRSDRLRLLDILDAIAVIQRDIPPTRHEFDANAPIRSHIQLDEASVIAMGFPHEFYQNPMVRNFVYGGMRDQIDV